MSNSNRAKMALIARDSAYEPDVFVYVNARDGTGRRECLPAAGRHVRRLTFCADHFIARGVCVDCTQEAGEIVYAS